MEHCSIHDERVRLLGRMDMTQDPVFLDWTGSGFEVKLRGSGLWAELEATAEAPVMFVSALVDGMPVTRFPVESGRRWYPLVCGMEPQGVRTVTLVKETQAMPAAPEAAVCVHGLRFDGELLSPNEPKMRIEFVGDSLTSAEGVLAPRGNDEWIPLFFSAAAGYAHICARELGAEYRILSQSGYGVNWDWQFIAENNMADGYRKIVGTQKGEAAEARGCQNDYDFSAWKADIVVIRLHSNDVGGMRGKDNVAEMRDKAVEGSVRFLKDVRACNPDAKIVWIAPDSRTMPELSEETVERCKRDGMENVSLFKLPDYTEEDLAARGHPGAEYNRRAGLILAEYLKGLTGEQF